MVSKLYYSVKGLLKNISKVGSYKVRAFKICVAQCIDEEKIFSFLCCKGKPKAGHAERELDVWHSC